MDKNRNIFSGCVVWAGILLLYLATFRLHLNTPFMMDDIWYGTNLATGQPLCGLADVLQGQYWHFMNWGGRCVTHAILQLTILSGELAADLMNLGMTVLLSLIVCKMADAWRPEWFLTGSVMIFACSANLRMSMFWQAGVVNYVYSTAWIMLFLWQYLALLQDNGRKEIKWRSLWMPILGLMTGWSNENMGPAVMLTAAGITLYLWKWKQERPKSWMIGGIVGAFLGSLLVILAPGNFSRASTIESSGLGEVLYRQFQSMLTATASYLFPVLAITLVVWFVYRFFCMERLDSYQICLVIVAVLAHGAMAISPHYPDRATFGIMVVCVLLTLSMLVKIRRKFSKAGVWIGLTALALWLRSIYLMFEISVSF